MSEQDKPLLQVNDLQTYFYTDQGVAKAVDGISFQIKAGECMALVGESGCGKTVTSLSIMRLLPEPPAQIAGGGIWFEGKDLSRLTQKEMRSIRGSQIAMIFQEPQSALNPVFKIGSQVSEAYRVHHPNISKREAWDLAVESLRSVGIPDPGARADDYPHQLSGGMKQRVCIAMALICNPKLLIADEPTTALDVTIQAQIMELLLKLREERNLAMLLITHDLAVVAESAERLCVMYAGKIVEKATVKDLFGKPLHPYTQGLLRARPEPHSSLGARRRLAVIPGMVPPATAFPDACRFKPRCPMASDRCEQEPPLENYDSISGTESHQAACHHTSSEGIEAWKEDASQPAAQSGGVS